MRQYPENRDPATREASRAAYNAAKRAATVARRKARESNPSYQTLCDLKRKLSLHIVRLRAKLVCARKAFDRFEIRRAKHVASVVREKERNRRRALEHYRANREEFNEARRIPLQVRAERAAKRVERWLEKLRKKLVRMTRVDPVQKKLRRAIRRRFEKAIASIKGQSWGSITAEALRVLGCSVPELKAHLESHFAPGMTWDNHGFGEGRWNVDHIRPVSSFDLTKPGEPEKAFHYSNLQPLWHEDNMAKGKKLDFSPGWPIVVT